MRTDRELLELAAKAVGLTKHRYCEAWDAMNEYTLQLGFFGPSWNPLRDDGDALRLAVKLGLTVEVDLCDDTTRVSETECELLAKHMHFDGDPEAATRRAIVRAAAHIGATKET